MSSRPSSPFLSGVVAAVRAAAKAPLPDVIQPSHSFVLDLGFDSMSMAILGLTLEDEFHCVILLDAWIGQHADPAALTVASLCAYLQESLVGDGAESIHD
jgi:acyl carrier protein